MTQSKRGWVVCFFLGMCRTPHRWPRNGSRECAYEKQMAHPRAHACHLHQEGPRGRRDRNSTMLSSPDHTGHVALLLAMSAPQDPNWARYNSATPPPARPKFCIDLAWGVTNNWKKNWPGRRGAPKAPRVHPHSTAPAPLMSRVSPVSGGSTGVRRVFGAQHVGSE